MIKRLRGTRVNAGLCRVLSGPWLSLTYNVNEYAAAVNLIIPRGIRVSLDAMAADVIKTISAIKLHEGGAAMLAALIINHSIDMEGMMIFNPLLSKSLREFDIE